MNLQGLYLLLVTNKASNILEDLETLRLLAKVVPEYVDALEEDAVGRAAFELIFAFDEVISLGYRENITVVQVTSQCAWLGYLLDPVSKPCIACFHLWSGLPCLIWMMESAFMKWALDERICRLQIKSVKHAGETKYGDGEPRGKAA